MDRRDNSYRDSLFYFGGYLKYPKDYINKIICGDHLDLISFMPDEIIDLTVTSPPYDDLRNYQGYVFDYKKLIPELYRITKQGGVVVWVVGDMTKNGSETGTSFKQALFFMECGFNLHDTMIYQKDMPPYNDNRYQQEFEYMFIFVKGKLKTWNPIIIPKLSSEKRKIKKFHRYSDGTYRKNNYMQNAKKKLAGNIWYYCNGGGNTTKDKIAYNHPAIFPDLLAYDHIRSWSNENDIVLDPMCGSGTTCKVAKNNKRQYIGIDCCQKYCYIARERCNNNTLFEYKIGG
jgi:site-specific DNA-methyltransferase (adenine-specific)